MLTNLLISWLETFRLNSITGNAARIDPEHIVILAEVCCPLCGQSSRTIHSHYDRSIADLSWSTRPYNGRFTVSGSMICARTIIAARRLNQQIALVDRQMDVIGKRHSDRRQGLAFAGLDLAD